MKSTAAEIVKGYKDRLSQLSQALNQSARRYNMIAYSRLVVFVGGALLCYQLLNINTNWGIFTGVVAMMGFLALVKWHSRLAYERQLKKYKQEICKEELNILNRQWTDRASGKAFIDPDHPYTFDLDIFGRGSLYQYINRTTTILGNKRLADLLENPVQQVEKIRNKQNAIQELSQKLDWSIHFQALGKGSNEKGDEIEALTDWIRSDAILYGKSFYRWALIVFPLLFIGAFLLWLSQFLPFFTFSVPWHILALFFFVNLLFVGRHLNMTSKQHAQISRKSEILEKYAAILKHIEGEEWHSTYLQQNRKGLDTASIPASQAIRHLGDIAYYLDQRLNMIAGILLNGMLIWDIQYVYRLEKWKATYAKASEEWWNIIGDTDAMVSLGRYATNHPEFTYPEVQDEAIEVRATEMGHPLLNPKQRVDNPLNISKAGEFHIITGANMAGKSTYLRATGLNLLTAMMGLPVCAKTYSFHPVPLITSMRATDSLTDHESYFYAELKRLKKIIDLLSEGQPIFILVDEMLRGTNSKDKQTGSRKFIEQLIKLNGLGMIATHDLSLGSLATEYPGRAINERFEVEINNDQLFFDYQLKEGISQNLNATFLMEKMGIM